MYYCIVEDNQIFENARIEIDSIDGTHERNKTIDDVRGLKFDNITSLNFFPQNLQNFFKNLTLIQVRSSNLQEITQDDLLFENLQYLYLDKNNLKTIEAPLFQHNKKLKIIWLDMNEISQIDTSAFDRLDDLNKLDLSNNNCQTSFNYAETRTEVLEVVGKIKTGECMSIAFIIKKFNKNLENLQTETKESKDEIMTAISLDNKITVVIVIVLSMMMILLGFWVIKNEKTIKNLTSKRGRQSIKSETVNNSMYEEIRESSISSLLPRH